MSQNNLPKHLKPSRQSSIASITADPAAKEGICPLCGKHTAVTDNGYCLDEECRENAMDRARRNPELKALYTIGGVQILRLDRLHRAGDPVQPTRLKSHKKNAAGEDILCGIKDCKQCAKIPHVTVEVHTKEDGQCEYHGCTDFAKPRDVLCNSHRRLNPKHPNTHTRGKGPKKLRNRIKGLDNIKLK